MPKKTALLWLIPIFVGLGALGVGPAASDKVAKIVNDYRAATEKLAESLRHNESIEAIRLGRSLHLQKYNTFNTKIDFNKKKLPIKLPKHALINVELVKYVKLPKLANSRCAFITDNLSSYISLSECGITNLNYFITKALIIGLLLKKSILAIYFDSLGNLKPH